MDIKNYHGMVLHLYKHLDGSMFDDDPRPDQNSEDHERTMLAFGNFDRICFDPVNRFVEFLSQSSDAHRWTGGRKDIMLYPLEADEHRHFVFGNKEPGYVQPPFLIREDMHTDAVGKRNFLLVSMLYVSSKAKAKINTYGSFLNYIKKAVHKIVDKYNNELKKINRTPIICEVCGTFNSSEIALLWAADQFTDVQYIVDHIRYLHFEFKDETVTESVFVSSYTIVALTDNPPDLSSVAGGAMIQLASSTAQGDVYTREYNGSLGYLLEMEKLKNVRVDCCAGEYDYIVESLPPHLELLLKPRTQISNRTGDGDLHVDNSSFKRLFSHSTTRLFYRLENIQKELTKIPWDSLIRIKINKADCSSSLSNQWENTRKIAGTNEDNISSAFKAYKAKILSDIHSTSTFGCNLDLLFSDYIQCVNTTPDRQWAEDLKTQFNASIVLLEKYFEYYRHTASSGSISQDFIDQVREVLSILEKQIHHVADAGKLLFEEPCSHSESTSQYDLLFHMYYGVAKSILQTMYTARNSKAFSAQSTLIPLIRFEPVPVLRSKLYFDLPEINQRLVDIAMPQNAWCEPGQYIPLLVHELYHYAAPLDRAIRNEAFAKILITETNTFAVQLLLEEARQSILNKEKYQETRLAKASDKEFSCSLIRVIQKVRAAFISYFQSIEIAKALGSVGIGDTQWKEYQEHLWDWYRGTDGYDSTAVDNFGYYLINALNDLGKKLLSELAAVGADELDKALFTILIHELTDTVSDVNYQQIDGLTEFSEFICQAQSARWDNLEAQLREIVPDVSMVQLSKIDAIEYLLIFSSFQDKTLISPGELREIDCCLPLRIGFILDFILASPYMKAKDRLKALMECKDEFCKKYIANVQNCRWSDHNKKVKPSVYAGKWFSFFVDQYEDYLANYAPYHEILRVLISEQIVPLCTEDDTHAIAKCSKEYFSAISSKDVQKAIFMSNIDLVHKFQPQEFLCDLIVPKTNDTGISPRSAPCWPTPKFISAKAPDETKNWSVTRSSEHSKPIAIASAQLVQTHCKIFGTKPEKCELWYRGSQNSDFEILPSLMVHFLDKEQLSHTITTNDIRGINSQGTLWEYQRSILEHFKNKADGAPEFLNSASYTASDYIALMQHYGQYTCYLDWSEDVYTALFFALESEVQREESKYGGNDASLYILDPMLYNRARKMLIKRVAEKYPETFCPNDSWMHKQANRIQDMPDGHIPNLSLVYNRDRFGMFSFDIPENEDVNTARANKYLISSGVPKDATLTQFELEMWNLPLAVYTSRLNARIRSQSGQFIAFSPFSIPVYSRDAESANIPSADRFSYLSLLKIQKYFLDVFKGEEPFMYEIKIRAFARDDVGDYLRKVGINRYRIYPELGNLKKF